MRKTSTKAPILWFAAIALSLATTAVPAISADQKPNILVIWGDDIGT